MPEEDAYSQFSTLLTREQYDEAAHILEEDPHLPVHIEDAVEFLGNIKEVAGPDKTREVFEKVGLRELVGVVV